MIQDAMPVARSAWIPPAGQSRRTVTPLYAVHRNFGAHFGSYAGMTMPIRYAGELTEAKAVRRGAGLFDLCYSGEISVIGPDAGALLDYALTGWASRLPIGRARYMTLCGEDGRIVEDVVVCRLDASEFLLVCNTANVDRMLDEIATRGRRFAARVDDRTEDYAVVAVEGPRARDIVGRLTPVDLAALRRFGTAETTLAGRNGVIARTGYTADDGYEFYCGPDDAAAVWYSLYEAGLPYGIAPAGLSCRDLLRLESGIALCGRELTRAVSPYDVGLGTTVALDKPDFVGRSALVARAATEGEIALVGLLGAGPRVPRAGAQIVDTDTGRQVGTVTSGAPSPSLGRPIAMALVNLDALASSCDLAAVVRGEREPVEITAMPFRRRSWPVTTHQAAS
ncbi:MAG: aminomethyltransferase [Cryptosporangiaceae bacterium]|nr:aminomethyltransferase [Cryptosporangiaceae bacterium]